MRKKSYKIRAKEIKKKSSIYDDINDSEIEKTDEELDGVAELEAIHQEE